MDLRRIPGRGLSRLASGHHLASLCKISHAAEGFSRPELSLKMQAACQTRGSSDASSKPMADALLFVSGSHPIRQLSCAIPASNRWLSSSVDMLRVALDLQHSGKLAPELLLWATENPNVNPPEHLITKVEAGASTVLTQPPFLWNAFEQWHAQLQRERVLDTCQLLVGMPILASVRNLEFWLELCGVSHLPAAKQLLASFSTAKDPDQMCSDWNRNTIKQVLSLPGVAGLHVMAVTDKSRRQTLELLRSGVLPSPVSSASP